MCLKTKDNNPKIAEEDIVVYKCFRSVKERYSSKKYRDMRTLFLEEKVSYEEMTGKVPFIGKGKNETKYDDKTGEYSVGKGYIHAYLDRETAKQVVHDYFIGKDWYFPVVVKVTIPKGTKYFEGTDTHGLPCIAAEQIVIGECLDCFVDHKFYNFDDYVSSLEKSKASSQERQPFE